MKMTVQILLNLHSYEAVFYSAFAMVLIGWIFVESANLYCSEESGSARRRSIADDSVFGYEERHLRLSDLRIPLLFVSLIISICLMDYRGAEALGYDALFLYCGVGIRLCSFTLDNPLGLIMQRC
jgi:hypothetical protein